MLKFLTSSFVLMDFAYGQEIQNSSTAASPGVVHYVKRKKVLYENGNVFNFIFDMWLPGVF
jgi:hypothetical protein